MSSVMINELTSVNTHSRCSVSECFRPSSLLKRGSGFCHRRSDCVPARKVYTCRSAASQTREGTRRTTKAGDGRAFERLLEGWWSLRFAGDFTSRWGTVSSSVSWTRILPKVPTPLEPSQQENGQPRSNPGRPQSGPLLRPIRGLRDRLWKGKDVSGGFNDASWERTSTVSNSSVQEAGELWNR